MDVLDCRNVGADSTAIRLLLSPDYQRIFNLDRKDSGHVTDIN